MENDTRELLNSLIRLEGKIDTVNVKLDALTDTKEDHEKRIRVLETRDNKMIGRDGWIGSTVGVLATIIGGIITVIWSHK